MIPEEDDLSLSYALRLAHDLDTFHKLDVEILTDVEASGLLEDGSLGPSNVVIFDGPKKTSFGRRLLGDSKHPLLPSRIYRNAVGSSGMCPFGRQPVGDLALIGVIFLHKHPTHPDAVTLFLQADDEICMENVLRLFPIRTGVFGPDWIAISLETATLGAAGVIGAG